MQKGKLEKIVRICKTAAAALVIDFGLSTQIQKLDKIREKIEKIEKYENSYANQGESPRSSTSAFT